MQRDDASAPEPDDAERTSPRWWGIAIGIVAIGGAVSGLLLWFQPGAEREAAPQRAPSVRTTLTRPAGAQLRMPGHGTVRPGERLRLAAQVDGEVVDLHPEMEVGGHFDAGELLVGIDPARYEAAVAQTRAQARATKSALDLARTELQRSNELVAREYESQVRLDQARSRRDELKAQLAAQRAAAEMAGEDLDDTEILAPFSGRVVSEALAVGQVVTRGQRLAEIHRTDTVEVDVPMDSHDAALVADALARGTDVTATIEQGIPGDASIWEGHVDRMRATYQPDAQTRSAVVVVEDLASDKGRGELVPGRFVDVVISAPAPEVDGGALVTIPAGALRRGREVWVVRDGRLHVCPVRVVHRTDADVVVWSDDLQEGTRLVTSDLETVIDGMAITAQAGDAPA